MGSFPPGADCAVLTGRAAADEEEEGPWKEEESYQKEEVPWRAGTEACLGEIQEAEGVQWEEIEEGTSFLKKGAPTLEEKEKKKDTFCQCVLEGRRAAKMANILTGSHNRATHSPGRVKVSGRGWSIRGRASARKRSIHGTHRRSRKKGATHPGIHFRGSPPITRTRLATDKKQKT